MRKPHWFARDLALRYMIRTEYHDGDGHWTSAMDDEYKTTRPVVDAAAARNAWEWWVRYWVKTGNKSRHYRLAAYKAHQNGTLTLLDAIPVGPPA